jgi:hypothetical protein
MATPYSIELKKAANSTASRSASAESDRDGSRQFENNDYRTYDDS